ncbi:unnamed protein product [Fusarium equiseti]|uniref:Uncharacterized protein n=1 Tax=Fusarium equiseti TaxID=61235 RepID=A0A8J2IWZ4_FUSEQ|nr:unnamed protein product [Fusarium equiseti]
MRRLSLEEERRDDEARCLASREEKKKKKEKEESEQLFEPSQCEPPYGFSTVWEADNQPETAPSTKVIRCQMVHSRHGTIPLVVPYQLLHNRLRTTLIIICRLPHKVIPGGVLPLGVLGMECLSSAFILHALLALLNEKRISNVTIRELILMSQIATTRVTIVAAFARVSPSIDWITFEIISVNIMAKIFQDLAHLPP